VLAHQIEGGCDNNNWAAWENVERDPPPIKGNQRVGEACDHWNRLEEDTELISKLGVKSYRFSIEWSKIEPTPGQKNEDAIRHYHKYSSPPPPSSHIFLCSHCPFPQTRAGNRELDLLEEAGIMPMLTLLHFTHPIWFEEMGAFEKEENNKHFIKCVFCGMMDGQERGSLISC
jgi:beta-glucosidase